jgi:hypothetical protein
MKNLTRYACVHDEQDGVCFCRIVESDHGEWVKFSDIEEALTKVPNTPCPDSDTNANTHP